MTAPLRALAAALPAPPEAREVSAQDALLLSADARVWLVEAGAVDLFSVEVGADGAPAGRRRPLARVGAGEALWPLPPAAGDPPIAVLAVPLPQTRLAAVSPADLAAAAGDGAGRAAADALVRAWTGRLADALADTDPDLPRVAPRDAAGLGPRLDAFHAMVAGQIARRRSEERAAERAALRTRRQLDRRLFGDAVTRLAGAVDEDPGTHATSDDPLFAALELAAGALGVELHRPPDGAAGLDVAERVAHAARASRVQARQVALRDRWWRRESAPLVAFREADGQPVALVRRPLGGWWLLDPAGGARVRVTARVAAGLQPFAFTLYRPLPDRALTAGDLWRHGFRGSRRDLLTVLAMAVAAAAVGLVSPIATGLVFSHVIPSGQRSQLGQIALGLAAAAVAAALFNLTRGLAIVRLDARFGASVQAAVWDRLLNLPPTFFRRFTAGDLATRAGAVDGIRRTLSATTLTALLSGVFASMNLVLLFAYAPSLALLGLGLVALALAVSTAGAVAQLRHERALVAAEGRLAGFLMELVTGMAKIRTAGVEKRAFARWSGLFGTQVRAAYAAEQVQNRVEVFGSAWPVLSGLAIFWMVGASLEERTFDTGDFLAFNAAFSAFLLATLELGNVALAALRVLPLWERARPILATVPEATDRKAHPGRLTGAVELSRVSFRYEADGPLVLKDVSLSVAAGESVAIVGPSGSGKSTLLRLLLGFETPTSGGVYVDGQDLAGLDLHEVRRQLGVVLQHGAVMQGDILSNIAGAARITQEQAWEAARLAGLDEDLREMPMGLHTVVPEGGTTLSGGQRQRLMLARALVRRPALLILDEATSALDNRTQARVAANIARLDVTRILVAHRLSTIVGADRIVVLEGGRVVEEGPYDALMALNGRFAQLARRQLLEADEAPAPP